MGTPATTDSTFAVLFICTGNICRSAFAERLGRAFLARAPGIGLGRLRLVSAGTPAVTGSAMDPDSALVLQALGANPDGFSARQMDPEVVASADLVLTMTREHRSEVLRVAPRVLARTFTLREAADLLVLLGQAGVEDVEAGEADPVARARALVRALAAARARRRSDERDDVPDPVGRPLSVHQDVGDAIAASLLPLLTRLGVQGRGPAGEPSAPPVHGS